METETKKVEPEKIPTELDKIIEANAETRKAAAELKEQLDRKEKLIAAEMLGGRAAAGEPQPTPVDPKQAAIDAHVAALTGAMQ